MSLYRRVSIRVWGDEKFKALSAPRPNAQTLFLYLLTGPHTGPIPGLAVAGEAQLSEALGWLLRAFRACFAEIEAAGMVIADWKARLIYLPNSIHHNPPRNGNMTLGWRHAFDELPDCALKRAAFADFLAYLSRPDIKESCLEPFNRPLTTALTRPLTKPSTHPLTHPLTGDQHEHEHEHEQLLPPLSPPLTASPVDNGGQPPRRGRASRARPDSAAIRAWGEIMAWLGTGSTIRPAFTDPRLKPVVASMGGWARIESLRNADVVKPVDITTTRKEFLELYDARRDRS